MAYSKAKALVDQLEIRMETGKLSGADSVRICQLLEEAQKVIDRRTGERRAS